MIADYGMTAGCVGPAGASAATRARSLWRRTHYSPPAPDLHSARPARGRAVVADDLASRSFCRPPRQRFGSTAFPCLTGLGRLHGRNKGHAGDRRRCNGGKNWREQQGLHDCLLQVIARRGGVLKVRQSVKLGGPPQPSVSSLPAAGLKDWPVSTRTR